MDLGWALSPATCVLVGGRQGVRGSHTQGEGRGDEADDAGACPRAGDSVQPPEASRGPGQALPGSLEKDPTLPTSPPPPCWTSVLQDDRGIHFPEEEGL